MSRLWLDITSVGSHGAEFTIADQSLWTGPWLELGLPLAECEPLEATLAVLPGEGGWFVTGRVTGAVTTPCGRCTANARVDLDHEVNLFEPRPGADAEDSRIRITGDKVELDAAALLWEEFVLALPVKPLCREDCAGLCPVCGGDRNADQCQCRQDEGDPRMAVFRGLKVSDH